MYERYRVFGNYTLMLNAPWLSLCELWNQEAPARGREMVCCYEIHAEIEVTAIRTWLFPRRIGIYF